MYVLRKGTDRRKYRENGEIWLRYPALISLLHGFQAGSTPGLTRGACKTYIHYVIPYMTILMSLRPLSQAILRINTNV